MLATKPIPHESCSWLGSYNPCFGGSDMGAALVVCVLLWRPAAFRNRFLIQIGHASRGLSGRPRPSGRSRQGTRKRADLPILPASGAIHDYARTEIGWRLDSAPPGVRSTPFRCADRTPSGLRPSAPPAGPAGGWPSAVRPRCFGLVVGSQGHNGAIKPLPAGPGAEPGGLLRIGKVAGDQPDHGAFRGLDRHDMPGERADTALLVHDDVPAPQGVGFAEIRRQMGPVTRPRTHGLDLGGLDRDWRAGRRGGPPPSCPPGPPPPHLRGRPPSPLPP